MLKPRLRNKKNKTPPAAALFHEGTHGLDYTAGISPYADDEMPARYIPPVPVSEKFLYGTGMLTPGWPPLLIFPAGTAYFK